MKPRWMVQRVSRRALRWRGLFRVAAGVVVRLRIGPSWCDRGRVRSGELGPWWPRTGSGARKPAIAACLDQDAQHDDGPVRYWKGVRQTQIEVGAVDPAGVGTRGCVH